MKLLESKVEYLPQAHGENGIYKQVELAGRTAYKSEHRITSVSAKDFTIKMKEAKHYTPLEHGTIYLMYSSPLVRGIQDCMEVFGKYKDNPYSKYVQQKTKTENGANATAYVTTNLRVLINNNWVEDLQYLCEPTEFHEKRYTFKFTTSIGIVRELRTHRVCSFLNESTRYVNYSKRGLEFIIPYWAILNPGQYDYNDGFMCGDGYLMPCSTTTPEGRLLWMLSECEDKYNYLITKLKQNPQQAREILPLATKSDLVMTGFASDWRYILDLRLFGKTGKPHPDMLILMKKFKHAAEDANIWNDIMKYSSKFEQ